MGWSLTIGRIAGTEIRIHITFLLFLAWIGFIYYQVGGSDAAMRGLLFIIGLFVCVLLHELGHVTAARRFGIQTPDITLLPIGGVARMQRMPDKPTQEIIVALAGPAVNIIIAGVIVLSTGTPLDFSNVGPREENSMLSQLATVNVFLAVFNLIPAFPMDGGRVLRALLALKFPYAKATRVAAGLGQGFAFLFGFMGLFGNPMLIFIALFLYLGASQEAAVAGLKDMSSWLSVSDATVTDFTSLTVEATAADAAKALLRTSQHEFPVVDSTGRVLGIVTRDEIINALSTRGPDTPIAEMMRRGVPVVRENASLEEAFELMQESDTPALPVVGPGNRIVGLLTLENIGELMMIRSVLPEGKQQVLRKAVA
ncbi:MAG TPA: site-2 protease family protein [Bryobacteraceae bacterium]|jgi:Zn-dependent protease/CBS domain-containing protein|nr:site-2 protease family protein [Bryobacteraceae bacterium]